jgi:hypothetical protein
MHTNMHAYKDAHENARDSSENFRKLPLLTGYNVANVIRVAPQSSLYNLGASVRKDGWSCYSVF